MARPPTWSKQWHNDVIWHHTNIGGFIFKFYACYNFLIFTQILTSKIFTCTVLIIQEACTWTNIARVYEATNEMSGALSAYSTALELASSVKDYKVLVSIIVIILRV